MAETQLSTESGPKPVPAPRRAASKSTAAKPAKKPTATKVADSAIAAPAVKVAPARKPASPKAATAAKPATAKRTTTKPAPASARAQTAEPATSAKPKSKDTSATAKEHAEHVERIWELAKRIGICMFVTWDGERQRARPLAATVEKAEGALYFLVDVAGEKDDQIERFPVVTLAFADHAHAKYVSITGKATVANDRKRIKDLWSPFAKAWWDSPEDPNIRVVKVVPQDAELWDSPGRIVSTISMLAAAVTRRSPKIGENAKVAF